MCNKLYLNIESAINDDDFSLDYQREIDVKNVDEEMGKEILRIITSGTSLTLKKIQCSKVMASIELENYEVKFEYRLSIIKMVPIPISEAELINFY